MIIKRQIEVTAAVLIALVSVAVMAWNCPTFDAKPEPAPCPRFCVDCPPFCAGAYVPPGE